MVPNPYDLAKSEYTERRKKLGTYEDSLKSGKTKLDVKTQSIEIGDDSVKSLQTAQ